MHPTVRRSTPLLLSIPLIALPASAQDNEVCLECHGSERLAHSGLYVDWERYDGSKHGMLDCVMCHSDLDGVEEYPHAKELERVDCMVCHDDDDGPVSVYKQSTHGVQALELGNALAPLCQDCHGDHYIIELDEPDSAISPFKITGMCAQCHATGGVVERVHLADMAQTEIFERYKESIHGEGLYRQGLTVTAVCTSCHTGHDVLDHENPRSTIHKDRVVETCMQCHGQIEEVHRKVIAGELWEAEGVVPICVECHLPHEARVVFYDTLMSNRDCLGCHSDQQLEATDGGRSLYVDEAVHGSSVHGRNGVSCAQCHAEAQPSVVRSCSTITAPVDCSLCHEQEVGDYETGYHGQLHARSDPNAPYCTDCHGDHDILEHQAQEGAPAGLKALIRESPTYSRNVPALCGRCHQDGAAAARRYLGPTEHIIERYSMSIHGKGLLESGLTVTAVCTDCHTPHRELPVGDPASSVSPDNIADTCGQCHDGIYEQYQTSVHSVAGNPGYVQERGMPGLPHCNDCHSSHTMARTDRPEFQLGIIQECGSCHQDITDTYFESYHGKASALGNTTRAKCYDCHGAHGIHPGGDPRSTLNEANIVGTCAQCHPQSHAQFTQFVAHADYHDRERYPILFYAFWGMTGLLVSVFLFFGLHTAVWLPRSWRLYKQHRKDLAAIPPASKQYMRFKPLSRGLHLTVILSFFGLAITGMMLKFSGAAWARALSHVVGGIEGAGLIHRICAIATFGYMGVHLWNVFGRFRRSDKKLLPFLFGSDTLLPTFKDVRDFKATMKWFVGRGPMPNYGRWTYWEKFDYLAVFWGVVIIGVSGLLLWYPVFFTRFLPGWAINVATIIHSDEALLAVGFIFTIHFFNTHLRPEKFPIDPVIFTGRMSLEELKLERPAHYEQLLASGELERRLVDPAPPHLVAAAKVFGYGALLVGVSLIVLIVASLLGAI